LKPIAFSFAEVGEVVPQSYLQFAVIEICQPQLEGLKLLHSTLDKVAVFGLASPAIDEEIVAAAKSLGMADVITTPMSIETAQKMAAIAIDYERT